MTAVRPIASAISARRAVGSMAWAREAGCSSRTVRWDRFALPPGLVLWTVGEIDREQLDELGDAPRLGGRAPRGEGRLRAEDLRHGAQAGISQVQFQSTLQLTAMPQGF